MRSKFALAICATAVLLVALSPAALAGGGGAPKHHGAVWSCHSAPQPALDNEAGTALESQITWHQHRKVDGWSECLFMSNHDTFTLLDMASTTMLTRHSGHALTAHQEYNQIDGSGVFPRALQYIGPDHTQFLRLGKWAVGYQDDVVSLVTFGYYHKVDGKKPTFPHAFTRLSDFMYYILGNF